VQRQVGPLGAEGVVAGEALARSYAVNRRGDMAPCQLQVSAPPPLPVENSEMVS
jgi:hypothetical protein